MYNLLFIFKITFLTFSIFRIYVNEDIQKIYALYNKRDPYSISIDEDIKPIYEDWLNDCFIYNVEPDLNRFKYVHFSDTLNSNYAGLYVYKEGVLIKEYYRNSKYLKVIVYHELGHAAFALDHDTINTSIMSPYFSDFLAQIYLTNWEKYKQQYFESIKSN